MSDGGLGLTHMFPDLVLKNISPLPKHRFFRLLLSCMMVAAGIEIFSPAAAQTKPVSTAKSKDSGSISPVLLPDSAQIRAIRRTVRQSAILPGLGQFSNKQAWKVPFVYTAIGIPVYLFFDNVKQYRVLKDAYIIKTDNNPLNDVNIPDNLKPLSANSIKFYRDQFRRNVDYSVLAFLIAWGLNVVDAAVFANLRGFDVSDKLSIRLSAPSGMGTGMAGIGISISGKHPAAGRIRK